MSITKLKLQIKKGPLATVRGITIDPQYIELEGPLSDTRFTKEDIEGFRYGVQQIGYYIIPVSRTYNIEVKSTQGKIIKIRMHTFFGIRQKKTEKLFVDIYNKIYEAYFNDMAIHYAQLLNGGLTYELGGAMLSSEGIDLKRDKPLIPWIRVGITSYFHSCSLYDLSDTYHFRSFDYWHDWNASLLRAIVNYKLQNTTYELLR